MDGTATAALPAAEAPLFSRIAPLFVVMFVGFLTVSMPLPALPLHVTATPGFGTAIAGLTVGLQSLATVMTRAPAGRLVDEKGAKTALARGLAVASVAGLLYLLSLPANATPALSLAILLLGRLTLGVGEGLLITGVLSWALLRVGPGRAGPGRHGHVLERHGAICRPRGRRAAGLCAL